MTGTAIVIGAGIGGLATAKALRDKGWHVEILERSTHSTALGSGLSIAPNAVHALRRLGLDSAFFGKGRRLDGLEARLHSGTRVMRVDSAALTTKYGEGLYAVERAELHRLLLESIEDVPLHLGRRVIGVATDGPRAAATADRRGQQGGQGDHMNELPHASAALSQDSISAIRDDAHAPLHDNSHSGTASDNRHVTPTSGGTRAVVTVDHPDGPYALRADLVVVADGVHSRLRQALFPDHPGARYAGYAAWRGIVAASAAAPLAVRPVLAETWGSGMRVGVMPLRDGRVYWYAFDTAPESDLPAPDPEALAARCASWPDPIPALLAATAPASTLVRPVHYLAHGLPSFVRGPIALVGDAAHAVTPDVGQGACLALEDAVVLAAAVTDYGVPNGLRAYDTQRRPRTERIAQTSGRMGRALQGSTPAAARLRDIAARLTPDALNARFANSLYDWTPPTAGVTAGWQAEPEARQPH
ncbi:FAD-dependent monooxygenase [Nocardia sp. NPDC050406]|uniref:FAD-dependent monooxygenase n=1 Tax=Nocardia sp. NPDC050406 TaxID=3364318 RepID=UPI0037933308